MFFQIADHIPTKKKVLFPFLVVYLLLITVIMMTSPTNASFTSTVTQEGQIAIHESSDESKDEDDQDGDKKRAKQHDKEQDSGKDEDDSSADDETDD